jgi:Zn-dependent protease with chaperone function
VLRSDSLLAHADRRQIQAVFAHEAGHMQQHHIFYSVLFTLTVVAWGSLLNAWATTAWPALGSVWQAVTLPAMAAGWGFGFGWISRRFERQSDVIAAWSAGRSTGVPPGRRMGVSPKQSAPRSQDGPNEEPQTEIPPSPEPLHGLEAHATHGRDARATLRVAPEGVAIFASALRRVAQLNGISPTAFNWRHGSIEFRVNYLMALAVTGGTRGPIDRQVRRIKLATWAAALAAAAAVIGSLLL